MSTIKVGSKVLTPVTDADGEVSYEIGTLTAINSRMATVELGNGETIKVGKTKIEATSGNKAKTKIEAGEDSEDSTGRIAANYEYKACKSASGRTSCDNDDNVAQTLREKTIDEAYAIVAKAIGETQKDLKTKYGHLNAGQQRMCIGNRLRGFHNKKKGS